MMTDAELILLPGTLCDERVFTPVLAALGSTHRTLALCGAASTHDMAGLILEQAPPRFALCGFSLGAIVALEVMALAPERVERLALLGCNARAVPADKAAARRATVAVAQRKGTASYLAAAWDASVPAWRHDDKGLRAELEDMATATPLTAFRDQIEISINRRDMRSTLGTIVVPTLVACGEEDRICPPDLTREIAEAIPGATLAIVERAGHYLTLDQPDAVARLLRDWLAAPLPIPTQQFAKEFS